MTNQTTNNWLEPFRKQAGFSSRYSLGKAVNRDERTIQRWENYETKNNIPFEKLAEILKLDNVNHKILKEAHQNGLIQFDILQAKKQPMNINLIIESLEDCELMGLTGEILQRMQVNDIKQAVEQIITWLQQGDMQAFEMYFNQCIETAVKSVEISSIKNLEIIQQLVESIALAATIPLDGDGFKNNQHFKLTGVKKAFSIRLTIDAIQGDGMSGISAINSTELKTLGGVKIEEPKEDDVWPVVHAIIKNLWEDLLMDEEPFPDLCECEEHLNLSEVEQYSDFTQYCKDRVDPLIRQTKYMTKHCFVYSLQEEAQQVQQRVIMLLPSVRVFICSEQHQGVPILRFDEKNLEQWLAFWLYAINKQRETVNLFKPVEETAMKNNQTPDIHINVNTGDNSSFATEGSNITQIPLFSESEQLSNLLKQIFELTDRSTPEHQQLRVDVNDISTALQQNNQPHKEAKSWLQEALAKLKLSENIKNGTALITLIEKSLGLFG